MSKESNAKLEALLRIYELPLPQPVKHFPSSSGIYFLEREDVLEYVGKTSNFFTILNNLDHIYKPEIHKVYIIEIDNPHLCAGVEAALISLLKPKLNTSFNPDTIKPNDVSKPNLITSRKKNFVPSVTQNNPMIEIARILLMFEVEQQYKQRLITEGKINKSDKIDCIWTDNMVTEYRICK